MRKRSRAHSTRLADADEFGKFLSRPQTEWDDNGRDMYLLRDCIYEDPKHYKWTASVESKVNGASIPQIFWSLIGGPYEGLYRNAFGHT